MTARNILSFFAIVLLLIFILSYLILPTEIKFSEKSIINCRGATINRIFTQPEYSYLLWSGAGDNKEGRFSINGITFDFSKDFSSKSIVNLIFDADTIPSVITSNTMNTSEVLILWSYTLQTQNTPWSKIKMWACNRVIKKTIRLILNNLKKNAENPQNVYKTKIEVINLSDSTLISVKGVTLDYPSTTMIYNEIKKLTDYAGQNQAVTTHYPMLNVRKEGSQYFYMIALPINKDLRPSGIIEPKRMLSGGKFLRSDDIYGGLLSVQKMEKHFEHYKLDYSYSSPAISFQSLITDRSVEPDSNKWVTKLYYPIF
jgi:hypothetical protein